MNGTDSGRSRTGKETNLMAAMATPLRTANAAAVTTIFEEVSAEEWYVATESIADKRKNT